MNTTESLYEKLGGKEGIAAVVDRFYEKVFSDPVISHFFQETNMEKQRRHQTLFISWATGGPNQYSGKSMAKAHAGMNLQEEHFCAVASHLIAALLEFNVPEESINQVIEKVISMKETILYQ